MICYHVLFGLLRLVVIRIIRPAAFSDDEKRNSASGHKYDGYDIRQVVQNDAGIDRLFFGIHHGNGSVAVLIHDLTRIRIGDRLRV